MLFSMAVIMIACNKDEVKPTANGSLAFGFTTHSPSGGRMNQLVPSFVLITIEDSKGDLVEEDKKLPLYAFGSSYVSEVIKLSAGSYNLLKFMVLDENNKVLYATPLENSSLANLVNDPLPINFSISENNQSQITPQVLQLDSTVTPEKFGYASFGFEIVDASSSQNRLKEVIYYDDFVYGNYVTSRKVGYQYDGDKLIKKQFYAYLKDYWSFVPTESEVYTYQNEKLKKIELMSANPQFPNALFTYLFDYSTNRVVQDFFIGDPAKSYNLADHYETTTNSNTLIVTDTHVGQVYKYEGELNAEKNFNTLLFFDLTGNIEHTVFSGYLPIPNPLSEKDRFPDVDPLFFNDRLNTQTVYTNLSDSRNISTIDYTYTFDSKNRPTTIFIKNVNSFSGTKLSKIELSYLN
jgi:hypothetical protein